MSTTPVVNLFRNPWSSTLSNKQVYDILAAAAGKADWELTRMIESHEVEPDRNSFGAVLLDPTFPVLELEADTDLVLATIEIGPDAMRYLPNGMAKAHAHARHGVPNRVLVESASHCLGNGDFAWGNSVEYNYAIGGGSGLSAEQDGQMVELILREAMDAIRDARDNWIAGRRKDGGSQGWYNQANEPGEQYAAILMLTPLPII